MTSISNKETIRKFIVKEIAKKEEHMQVSDQENIVETGLIDSLGIMQLVLYLEKEFFIKVKDEDIIPEHFESIDAISAYIGKSSMKEDAQ
jgi:acyl carrier protein